MRIACIKIVLQRVLSKLTRDRSVLILHYSMSCEAAFKRFWNHLEKLEIFLYNRVGVASLLIMEISQTFFTKLLLRPAPCFLVLNTHTGHGLGEGQLHCHA